MTSRDNEGNETLSVPRQSPAEIKMRLLNAAINTMILLIQTEPDESDRAAFAYMAKVCQGAMKRIVERN